MVIKKLQAITRIESKSEIPYKISSIKYEGFLKRIAPKITEIMPKKLKITRAIATTFNVNKIFSKVESINP